MKGCSDILELLWFYQSLDDLIISVRKYNYKIDTFDCSCFNGEYITDGVSSDYLENLRETRKPK